MKDLVDLLIEASQEVPQWLETLALTHQKGRARGQGKRFSTGFGSRDYRQQHQQPRGNRGGMGGGQHGMPMHNRLMERNSVLSSSPLLFAPVASV